MRSAIHVVCPHCDAINRIPTARLNDGGKCGTCHQLLFDGHPVALTEACFDKHIGRNDLPVVVDFWVAWCGPCRIMAPIFEQAARQLEPRARFIKVDTEAASGLSDRFQISSIPTLIVFRGGNEVARSSGAMPLQRLVNWLESAILAA